MNLKQQLKKQKAGLKRLKTSLGNDFKNKVQKEAALCHSNTKNAAQIRREMTACYRKWGYMPQEYARFGFYDKSETDRAQYASAIELFNYFKNPKVNHFPPDKYNRYLTFRPFFHREVLCFNFDDSPEEKEQFETFVKNHDAFILKPIKGFKGKGVRKCDTSDVDTVEKLKECAGGRCIIEPLIRQGGILSEFHPSSINTVRMVTGMNPDGEFYYMFALLRTGQGGSFVDNVGSGGLIALIDMESGTVKTDAICDGKYYSEHPDTGKKYIGARIPRWEGLKEIAKTAHQTLPEQKLIGWDFSYTAEDTWDLVEANPAPSFTSYQTLTGRGVRPELVKYKLI